MKKQFYYKYMVSLAALTLLAFLLLVTFLYTYTLSYFREKKKDALQDSADDVSRFLVATMDLAQTDFETLLTDHRDLLLDLLSAQRNEEGMELFLTDKKGTILLATDPLLEGKKFEAASVTKFTAYGRDGVCFESDLGGMSEETLLCRVLVMEKIHYETLRNREGLIFLTVPASTMNTYTSSLLNSFLVACVAVTVAFSVIFLLFAKNFMKPLHEIARATESYTKGDFSVRLDDKKGGELKPLIRGLNQMAEMVENNEKSRQSFVSNISHDLRTPLTTIGGFVQNLMAGVIPADRRDHYYGIILEEVNRLSRLVQTLLETSRMTSDNYQVQKQSFDLCELGRVTLLSFEEPLEKKKIHVSFESDRDSYFVYADSDAITRVIYNLIDNAIKFTEEEGTITVKVEKYEQKVFFAVRNSGEGIPEEEVLHLFERFYKSDRSRGLDKKGMGLGLFIAKTVMDAHGEEIWVESEVGHYTEFVFSLPIDPKKR